MTDEQYMRLALDLALKGGGHVNPNPLVGAVIVKDGQIIGSGYHERYGGLHAERNALASCSVSPEGATLYVTLEPCCHYGKTPPCTEAIIENKISRVVIGSSDPNPLVAGKGVRQLRSHGIQVDEGLLQAECDRINQVFFHFISRRTPYVVMKYAMTMDGKIAAASGQSQWITGEEARKNVHKDRSFYTAIMVGIGTALTDDPLLTCRIPGGRNPVRIICDTHLRLPLSSRIAATASEVPTIILTCCKEAEKRAALEKAGCRILFVPEKDGHVDLSEAMKLLGEQNIDSILLEGGASLNWSALKSGIVNKVQVYIGSVIFGGAASKSPVGGPGAAFPKDGFRLSAPEIRVFGNDILLESEVILCSPES